MQIIRVAEAYPPQIPMKSVTNPTLLFSPALLISTSSSNFPSSTHYISPVYTPFRNLLSIPQAKSALLLYEPRYTIDQSVNMSSPQQIKTTVTDLLKIKHPVMLAGMNVAAGPKLAAAVTNAGGIGVIGGVRTSKSICRS